MQDRKSSYPGAVYSGRVITSEVQASVRYRLERCIGEGGMGQAYLALRQAPEGISPVVVKIVRPQAGSGAEAAASILAQKEAVALGRLNERVPPCPFVVRFIDTGSALLDGPGRLATPWLALEYVHGGVEGTTLEERASYCIDRTTYAFDAVRAAHMIRCVGAGLSAIHSVGVIHRDLTPNNILCCGFGEAEIFKISDFGVARPQGLTATFGGVPLGTVGYAAPEQSIPDDNRLGPFTDIFSFACVIYFILTGQPYFPADTPFQVILMLKNRKRRSVLESEHLIPELRERAEACQGIDQLLARATSHEPLERPQQAQELVASLIPWLTESPGPKTSRRLLKSMVSGPTVGDVAGWEWSVRHPVGGERVIRSAAWDADSHCLVLTTRGPAFWNGQQWLDARELEQSLPPGMVFARRFEAGGWLVGGAGGKILALASDGVREVVRAPSADLQFLQASGRFDDLLVAVAQKGQEPVALWTMASRRWLKPLPLSGVVYVAALLRLEDSEWLVCGRRASGQGFAAIFSPLQWELRELTVPATRALVGGATQSERGLGLVVGSDGVAVRIEGGAASACSLPRGPDLTAAAMDVLDREWVTSLGKIWVRDPEREANWSNVWSDATWTAPFVSVMAEPGLLVAMTADGGVLEGRAMWRGSSERKSRQDPNPTW